MPKRWNFPRVIQRVKTMKSVLPTILGGIMKKHFEDSFTRQGFTDASLSPWAKRKIADTGRAILVESGDLRGSIRIKQATFSIIRVGSYGIPYASRHNKGLSKMTKRQFIGRSLVMTKKIKRAITQGLRNTFR